MNAPRDIAVPPPRAAYANSLARLDRWIEREALRLRARYALSLDELRGLYVSDAQVDAWVDPSPVVAPDATSRIAALTAEARAMAPGMTAERAAGRWAALRRALALDAIDDDLLMLALAPEIDSRYEALYAYLNNDVARRWLCADLAQRLLSDEAAALAVRAALAPDGRLVAAGVLVGIGPAESSRAQRGWRLAPALADWLQGLPWVDERLPARVLTAWISGGDGAGLDDPGVPRAQRAAAARIASRISTRQPFAAVISAPAREDALYLALQIVEETGRDALQLDLDGVRALPSPAEAMSALSLRARATGQPVLVGPLDAVFDAEGRPMELLVGALRGLDERVTCLYTTSEAVRWREVVAALGLSDRPAELRMRDLDAAERAALWTAALAGAAAGMADSADVADAADTAALADRFMLGPDRIRRAAQLALDQRGSAPLDVLCRDAARTVSAEGASSLTRRIDTPLRWDDLVLPSPVMARLRAVLRAIELRPRVLDDWGLVRRLGGARSINVMFAGVSGTGKTMAASLIAAHLGLDLHRVELAQVVSKYIGETEKNLDRAFDIARRANAILFIDEADALLGKRSEVKDAHDRHANVEIAYLLQKMEDHDGVVIVATNLASNIDDAFTRRMQFVIEFPLPDAAARERLWLGMLPPGLPRESDIDFGFIARQFPMAGGDIRNVVLDAAYAAAARDGRLSMRDLVQSIARQQAKRGRMVDPAHLREYASLLEAR